MHDNPFYPSFTLRPEQFFGRKEHLRTFLHALQNENSPDISFMLTGTRGCGKTSLLHQYAINAEKAKMDVVEATSADVLERLREYARMDRGSSVKSSIAPSLTVGGVGSASLGEITKTSTDGAERRTPDALLAKYLCDRLAKFRMKNGLMVFVDEAQKLADDDLVIVGNAVQQAVTAGHRVGLVLCGLPQSYHKIRNVRSCTFLHRMRRMNLWCMGVDETIGFLRMMFARVPEMGLTQEQIYKVGEFSGGHPYLMQLVGDALYRVVEREVNPLDGTVVPVSKDMLREAERLALKSYKDNVLNNVLSGTRKTTQKYILTAYRLRDADGLVSTRKIAECMGMTTREASPVRNYALGTQVIQREGRGYISFALPHCKYIFEPYEYYEDGIPREARWRY